MNHASQLIYIDFDVLVSNLIFHLIHVIRRRIVVMNFHIVCTAIENLLHRFLTFSNHASIHYFDHQRQQIRFFVFDVFVIFVHLLICHLNNHESRDFNNLKHDEKILVNVTSFLKFDCQNDHDTQHKQLIFVISKFSNQQCYTKS